MSWLRRIFGGEPPAPPPVILDQRVWNEDWRVGDTAECVTENWDDSTAPWHRPRVGERFTVVGFKEGFRKGNGARAYFLKLEGWPVNVTTTAFRKVRPVASEKSEVVERILTAKPGVDKVREGV